MSDRGSAVRAVAIIGIGCRFPGGITDARSFWSFVAGGGDAITEIPRDRFDLDRYFDARPATPGRSMTRWGGFLGSLDKFDAEFFGLSPREAARLDPQQRLLLETAWEALEDAGQDVRGLEGSVTGVYIGQWVSDFESRLFADPQTVDFYTAMGTGRYASSGRLSYLLGLRGPSLTLDTACSSSLVAVHLAMQSIRSGESTLAIAGGVNLILQPQITIAYSQTRMMAPDGRCKFGDAAGDGYVRSEGVGLVILKALDRAILDGDRIYAVIRGSAVNNDGHSSGTMGRPSRIGQEELLRAAYRDADVAPSRVEYVEAHGTGTRAGDPVELDALGAVLREGRAASDRAQVGSVKTNFGHTEGAAGIAGLIKAALSLHHAQMAPSLHCKTLNPKVAWDTVPLEIVRERRAWSVGTAGHATRVAGVTAFGIGGTNAHVVLESAPMRCAADLPVRAACLLPLSARGPAALRELCKRYGTLLSGADARAAARVCASAASRRTALAHRAVCVAADGPALAELLAQHAAGDEALIEETAPGESHRIAFVIPGQGGQWNGMGRELCATEPLFREVLLECDRAARPYVSWSLLEELHRDPGAPGYALDRIGTVQPVLFALAVAYARWLRSVGVVPDAVVGHSMGEVAAAHLAGALSLGQAMQIICRRSALMQPMSGLGAMAVVDLPAAEVERRLASHADRLSVAVRNSAHSCVIAGDPHALAAVLAACEEEGIFCRRVNIDVASHSPQMDAPAAALVSELSGLAVSETGLPLYSTVLAREADGRELDAAYWGQNMRRPVRFDETVMRMLNDGITVFVELSPHAVLTQAIEQTARAAGNAEAIAFACGRRGTGEQTSLLRATGRLWAMGLPVALTRICGLATVDLPLYPWQRERHWIPEANPRESMMRIPRGQESLESKSSWLHQLRWRRLDVAQESAAAQPALRARTWLVVADDADCGTRFVRALQDAGAEARHVTNDAVASALRSGTFAGLVVVLPRSDGAAFEAVSITQQVNANAKRTPQLAPPRMWFVTCGAQAMESGASIPNPSQAGAWGAGRVLAAEHPEYWGGLIDLDPDASAAQNAADLVSALHASSYEDQVAIRERKCYGLRLEPLAPEALQSSSKTWRADGAYLITGGLGEIGLLIARAMVRGGAHRLILMGRTALPQRSSWGAINPDSREGRRIAAIRELEAQGASVHLIAADVSRQDDLEAAIGRYRAESWPPIVGIIHAAGVVVNQLALNMDKASFDQAFAPKFAGAQNLDRLFPDAEEFIVFSSITGLLGWAGTANYAAGNAGLDAVVAGRRARGAGGLSIQWGTWTQTGVFAGEGADRYAAELERQGIHGFGAEDGTAIFEWAAGSGLDSVTVMPIDWDRFRAAHAGRSQAMFAERATDTGAAPSAEQSFAAQLAAAPSADARQRLLEATILGAAASVLGVPSQKLDIRKPLGTSGLDSIMAIELRNRLEGILARPLSATLTWNYPTVESIARFLNDASAGAGAAEPGANEAASAAALAATRAPERNLEHVVDLSDEDVARQLRARVKRRG